MHSTPTMPSTSEIFKKFVQTASNASSAPRKHKTKLRQGTAAPVALTEQTTARTSPQKTAIPRRGHSANNDSDSGDDDPVSLLASFQQGRLGYKVWAERHKHQLTEDPEPSSHQGPQSRTDQDTIDTSSSEVPHSKRAARPLNQTGGRHPEPGSRCDACIIQRRGCDGVRPVCGRCTLLSRECKWHEEPISRKGLEDLRRKEAFGGAMRKPTKQVHDEMTGSYRVGIRPATVASREDEIIDRIACRARRKDRVASLKVREDAPRTVTQLSFPIQDQAHRPTILDAAALEQCINQWTYEDHLEMLETISQPRVDPVTKEEVFGHEKGNVIFDDTTKAFEDFQNLDDLDENMHRMETGDGLKLNWEESDVHEISPVVPNAALTQRGEWVPSNLRKRIGLSEHPMPTVEVPEDQENTEGLRVLQQQPYEDHLHLANLGDELRWMDDGLEEPGRHTEYWDDGGRLPRPDEAPNFSWCINVLDWR